jgi:hypothetical protein
MNINSQHHNLLGNQILTKLEDFCIWWPFCTLVTMATAAILNFVFMLQCQKVQNNCKILLKSNMVVTTTQSFYTGTNGEKINSSLH